MGIGTLKMVWILRVLLIQPTLRDAFWILEQLLASFTHLETRCWYSTTTHDRSMWRKVYLPTLIPWHKKSWRWWVTVISLWTCLFIGDNICFWWPSTVWCFRKIWVPLQEALPAAKRWLPLMSQRCPKHDSLTHRFSFANANVESTTIRIIVPQLLNFKDAECNRPLLKKKCHNFIHQHFQHQSGHDWHSRF